MSLTGWLVEWKNSFRSFSGIVINENKANSQWDIYELTDVEVKSIPFSQNIEKIRAAVKEYVKYLRNHYISIGISGEKLHQLIIESIEKVISTTKLIEELKREAIKEESRSMNKRLKSSKVEKNSKEEKEDDIKNNEKDNEESNDEVSEDDNEEEEEEDEDVDEEIEKDENESDDDDDTQSSTDKDEHKKVDFKVYTLPHNEIRGFYLPITINGFNKLKKSFEKDYGMKPKLYCIDSENEKIHLYSIHDFKYVYRSIKLEMKKNQKSIKLKIFADFGSHSSSNEVTKKGSLTSMSQITAESTTSYHGGDDVLATPKTIRFETVYQLEDRKHLNQSFNHDDEEEDEVDSKGQSPIIKEYNTKILETNSIGNTTASSHKQNDFEMIWKRGEILGSGSFGQVYSGINLRNGERMAVKEVSLHKIGKKQRQQAKALHQEVKILSSLDHPNIIKYLGSEFTRYCLRIFLELATSGTLKDALNEFGAFPEALIRRYTNDILNGLGFLHAKRFIHRDIKPTNLLISNGILKLADFGCSSTIFESDNTSNNDHHATVTGTTVYMAPEVMNASGSNQYEGKMDEKVDRHGTHGNPSGYGKKADIWSVGITLCEMSTARSPFKSAGVAIYCVCVSKSYPTFPASFSNDAHQFLQRCLTEIPKERANCADLLEHPFLILQSMDEFRAQTAQGNGEENGRVSARLKASTVKLLPSTHFSTLMNDTEDVDTASSRQEEKLSFSQRRRTSTKHDEELFDSSRYSQATSISLSFYEKVIHSSASPMDGFHMNNHRSDEGMDRNLSLQSMQIMNDTIQFTRSSYKKENNQYVTGIGQPCRDDNDDGYDEKYPDDEYDEIEEDLCTSEMNSMKNSKK